MKKINLILASTGKNQVLANTIKNHIDGKLNLEIIDLCELNFPLYTSAAKLNEECRLKIFNIITEFKSNDGFIIVSPEYNGGVPPVLSNFFAWVSISTTDWREAFNGKNVALATHSGGSASSLIAALRLQLSHMGLNTLGRTLNTLDQKPINLESLDAILKCLLR